MDNQGTTFQAKGIASLIPETILTHIGTIYEMMGNHDFSQNVVHVHG